jgi:hypothetical protein
MRLGRWESRSAARCYRTEKSKRDVPQHHSAAIAAVCMGARSRKRRWVSRNNGMSCSSKISRTVAMLSSTSMVEPCSLMEANTVRIARMPARMEGSHAVENLRSLMKRASSTRPIEGPRTPLSKASVLTRFRAALYHPSGSAAPRKNSIPGRSASKWRKAVRPPGNNPSS